MKTRIRWMETSRGTAFFRFRYERPLKISLRAPFDLVSNNSPPGVVSHNRTSEQKILLYYREILRYDSGRYVGEEKRKKVEQISRVPEHKEKF